MIVAIGTYVGTGSSKAVTDSALGSSTPKFVFIKGGANEACLCTDTMGADNTKPMTSATALFSGGVTSLDSGGFHVGTDARTNNSGTTYYYLAVAADATTDFETGNYTGNGLDNQNHSLSTLTGQISLLWIASAGAEVTYYSTSLMSGDNGTSTGGQNFATNQILNNTIQSVGSATFQVGNRASAVNTNGTVYHFIAWKNATGAFKLNAEYTGNATNGHAITGMGFQPGVIFTKRKNSTNAVAICYSSETTGNAFLGTASGEATNIINSIDSDGFTTGTNASSNQTGASYSNWGFKSNGPTTYNQTFTPGETPTGQNIDQVNKTLTASTTPIGSESLDPSKILSASVTPVVTIDNLRTAVQTLSASVSPTAVIIKQANIIKSAGVTPSVSSSEVANQTSTIVTWQNAWNDVWAEAYDDAWNEVWV